MERRKHWWNGQRGGPGRRDVLLFADGGRWWVEARDGGADGRSRWYELAGEDPALDCVRDLLAGTDDWRELPAG
jgi:hypothetical protein